PNSAEIARALTAADRARASLAMVFDDRPFEYQDRALEAQDRERERQNRERDVERYDRAQELLDDGKWEQAAQRFAQVAELKGSRADAALYWQAYALNRQGQRPESLQVIAGMIKSYPSSRYVAQAKALEAEVRRGAGQPVRPEAE